MSQNNEIKRQSNTTAKPQVTTYDCCYEHSYEHWIELRRLVEASDEEQITVVEETRELVLSA